MDIYQLKNYVVIPTLKSIDLYSESAVNLVMGTAYQESEGGKYIRQINGPAVGIYQMEPNTYDMIIEWYINNNNSLLGKVLDVCNYNIIPGINKLMCDIQLSTCLCRMYYYHITSPLPDANDIEGLAKYWKKYYNSDKGKGLPEEFVKNYEHYNVI